MKRINQFFLSALIILTSSCKENDGYFCTTEIKGAVLNFRVIDEESGRDLFFSDNPPFNEENLTVNFKVRDTLFLEVDVKVIKSKLNPYFSIDLPVSSDTVFLRVDNLSIDTITYSTVIDKDIPCSTLKLESLRFNKVPIALENTEPLVFIK